METKIFKIIIIIISLLLISFMIYGLYSVTTEKEISYENYKANKLEDYSDTQPCLKCGETTGNLTELQKQATKDITKAVKDKQDIDAPYIRVNPYHISPLTAVLAFSTKLNSKVTIKINGKEYTFEKAKDHIIPLVGLNADKLNKILVKAGYKKRVINIDLRKYNLKGYKAKITVKPNKKLDDGIYLANTIIANPPRAIVPSSSLNSAGLYGISREGINNLYLYANNKAFLMKPVILKNNNILYKFSQQTMVEVDLLGQIVKEYSITDRMPSHSATELPNGNVLINSTQQGDTSEVVFGKYSRFTSIAEYDHESAKTVKEWNIKTILEKIEPNFISINESKLSNPIYNNSVYYDEKNTDILFSLRDLNAIVCIDYTTSKIKWILGGEDYFGEKFSQYKVNVSDAKLFYGQHGISMNKDGNLLLFNNNIFRTKNNQTQKPSTAQIWHIKETTGKLLSEFKPQEGYTSDVFSNYKQIKNGNYVVNFGRVADKKDNKLYGSIIYELDNNNKIVSKIEFSLPVFSADKFYPYPEKINKNYSIN